eukprot:6189098-Pleurochrysis_carterae.AAC.1
MEESMRLHDPGTGVAFALLAQHACCWSARMYAHVLHGVMRSAAHGGDDALMCVLYATVCTQAANLWPYPLHA